MTKLEIRNKQGELLEAISEGAPLETADEILIMIHGLGTNLHERGLFDDIVTAVTSHLPQFSVVRFSWPGFGESEGKQEETTLDKVAESTKLVINFVKQHMNTKAKVYLFAHSKGNIAAAKLLTENPSVVKAFLANNPVGFENVQASYKKWAARPGTIIDEDGVMITPRADGTVSKFGPGYWKSIEPEPYRENITKSAKIYNSVLFRALGDTIVENQELTKLPFKEIIELHGDHNYSAPEDRKVFLEKFIEVLKK